MPNDPTNASLDDPRRLRGGAPLTIALIALASAAIVATAALTARSLSRLVSTQAALTESLMLEDMLKGIGLATLLAENGARGFMLTGRATWLQDYYDGLTKLLSRRDALNVALHDEPALAGKLATLNQSIVAKVQALAREVSLESEGRTQEMTAMVMSQSPSATVETTHDELHIFPLVQVAKDRIEAHRLEQARAIRTTLWTLVGSVSLNLVLLAGLVLRMRYAAAQQRRAREAMRATNAELSRLIETMAARHEQVQGLSELGRFLQSCADTQEAGRVLQRQLPVMMKAASGALYLFAASRNQLRQVFSWGEAPFADYLEPGECWALRLGQPYRQTARSGTPSCEHLEPTQPGLEPPALTPPRAAAAAPGATAAAPAAPADTHCLPLAAHGDLMGLLVLRSCAVEEDQSGDDEDHRRMTLEQVALSIGNLQLRESLRQQSIRDSLTGLYNRRFLEESARREVLRSSRLHAQGGHGGMALLMLDIDHFKRFNDQHGHEVGDRVLREVGQVLQRVTRDSDVAARYGGEEFTIVMTDTTSELGLQRAEQIRAEIERMAIEALGKAVGEVTISIGLAQYPLHGTTMEALFRAADRALYHAKHMGRNRVAIAAQMSTVNPASHDGIIAAADIEDPEHVCEQGGGG